MFEVNTPATVSRAVYPVGILQPPVVPTTPPLATLQWDATTLPEISNPELYSSLPEVIAE